MRVLRNPAAIRPIPRVVTDARVEAEALVARARAEADALREQARREGLAQGRAEAAAILARAAVREDARAAEQSAELGSLALDVARAILGREAESGPAVLRDVSQRALARVRRARRVVLHVHPDDAPWASEQARGWLPPGTEPEVFAVEIDASVERGGVVVESEIGRVDGRLSVQLEAIERAMRG